MAERLLVQVEHQTEHRIGLENRVIDADIRRGNLGLYAGWSFAMSLLIASVYLISTGHEGIGVTALLSDLGTLGAAFLYGDYRRRQERNKKTGSSSSSAAISSHLQM
jgi:hypothetical protein